MVDPTNVDPSPPLNTSQQGGQNGPAGDTDYIHTKVRTMGDLKDMLVSSMGEKDGVDMYNQLMSSISITMLNQVQQAADRAKQAAQEMRRESG